MDDEWYQWYQWRMMSGTSGSGELTPAVVTFCFMSSNQQENSGSGAAVRDSSMDGKASFALGVVYTTAQQDLGPVERVHLLTGSELQFNSTAPHVDVHSGNTELIFATSTLAVQQRLESSSLLGSSRLPARGPGEGGAAVVAQPCCWRQTK